MAVVAAPSKVVLERVKVIARVRPFTPNEDIERGTDLLMGSDASTDCVISMPSDTALEIDNPNKKSAQMSFNFDRCLYSHAERPSEQGPRKPDGNTELFGAVGRPMLQDLWAGYNVTAFAHGQSGAGKTYGMLGTAEDAGLIPRILEAVFDACDTAVVGARAKLKLCVFEIYKEKVYDLLSRTTAISSPSPSVSPEKQPSPVKAGSPFTTPTKSRTPARSRGTSRSSTPATKFNPEGPEPLKVRDDPERGVYVHGLTEHLVSRSTNNPEQPLVQAMELSALARDAAIRRRKGSHLMVTVQLSQYTASSDRGGRHSTMLLLDLTGVPTQAAVKRAPGPRNSNWFSDVGKGLYTLSETINAVADGRSQAPFRDSTLTQLMKSSLTGNTKVRMIANFSPLPSDFEESITTLRLAHRIRDLMNEVQVNEDKSEAKIRELEAELEVYRAQKCVMCSVACAVM